MRILLLALIIYSTISGVAWAEYPVCKDFDPSIETFGEHKLREHQNGQDYIHPDEIDNDLIQAIIQVESGGNPNAYNKSSGAVGLMQITPIVLKEYNDNRKDRSVFYNIEPCQLGDPEMNKIIGKWYLHRIKNHYLKGKYTIERMLACYHGGIGNLRKVNYDVNRMGPATRAYVKKVLAVYKSIQAQKG